jgi:hypothetical protein
MYPEHGTLIGAFGVQDAKTHYAHVARRWLSFEGRGLAPTDRLLFVWLDGYQQFNSNWKTETLAALFQLPRDKFKSWLDGDNKRRLLEAFTMNDVLTLGYSRWTGKFQQLPARRYWTPVVPAKRHRQLGEIVLSRITKLRRDMRLKVVISDDFSIVVDRDAAEARIPFIREMPADEGGPIPTIYLPFASSFLQDEVLEFFSLVNDGHKFKKESAWKLSWVQLADHLQMSDVLDAAAKWVRAPECIGMLLDWLPVTKLHSMQQRRPATADLPTMLAAAAEMPKWKSALAAALQRYGVQVVEHIGMDALLEVLPIKAKF